MQSWDFQSLAVIGNLFDPKRSRKHSPNSWSICLREFFLSRFYYSRVLVEKKFGVCTGVRWVREIGQIIVLAFSCRVILILGDDELTSCGFCVKLLTNFPLSQSDTHLCHTPNLFLAFLCFHSLFPCDTRTSFACSWPNISGTLLHIFLSRWLERTQSRSTISNIWVPDMKTEKMIHLWAATTNNSWKLWRLALPNSTRGLCTFTMKRWPESWCLWLTI